MEKLNENSDEKINYESSPEDLALINERPRIFCIDIDEKSVKHLEKNNFNIYSGTLGNKIIVPNSFYNDKHEILLNYDFPSNFHEYEIIVLDLELHNPVAYKKEDHIRQNHIGKSSSVFLSTFPETLFDPRPISSYFLKENISQIGTKPHIIVVFTTADYYVEYEGVTISESSRIRNKLNHYSIYSFIDSCPLSQVKFGKEMSVCSTKGDLRRLLETHLANATFNQTFYHTNVRIENIEVNDPNFYPLIKNSIGDIVSFYEIRENSLIFFFPQFQNKGEFLNLFLSEISPSILPDLFPNSTKFSWKDSKEYWLPNHKKLTNDKVKIQQEYDEKIIEKDLEITNNKTQYSFLHQILTETGDNLVDALIEYFKWLEFNEINKIDDERQKSQILEEDIQINLPNGLLIIECKGIGGTSTDSDCSQISKVKHRRCKERNKFDVFALYVVNHQRHLPPLKRKNPPFSDHQLKDAINDERGLLTTWQLFNAYFEVESGILQHKKKFIHYSKKKNNKLPKISGFSIFIRPMKLRFFPSKNRFEIRSVHKGDILEFDFFRTFCFTSADVAAHTESFLVHLCYHRLCPSVGFYFSLRQMTQVSNFCRSK